jgi:hypothetical protein
MASSACASTASPGARTPAPSPPTAPRSRSPTRRPSPPTSPTSRPPPPPLAPRREGLRPRQGGGLAGHTVTLKLKRADHRSLTRRHTLPEPTQLADRLYRTAAPLLDRDIGAAPFRLIGIGLSGLVAAQSESGDLADPAALRRAEAERARDAIRARWGEDAIRLGRSIE